ncbi:hypothetical protein QBC37DRAFT_425210 [Rhypophila decipiens]|uniref:Uncharacterized protein n=1 Tax=Rhypophila decipiens TaxID=261697 RepID=A0AAN6Y906_9PEZI|nr:hypothetical protein QBC37DRAFT_425210 [Rhypophila decipiens]
MLLFEYSSRLLQAGVLSASPVLLSLSLLRIALWRLLRPLVLIASSHVSCSLDTPSANQELGPVRVAKLRRRQ